MSEINILPRQNIESVNYDSINYDNLLKNYNTNSSLANHEEKYTNHCKNIVEEIKKSRHFDEFKSLFDDIDIEININDNLLETNIYVNNSIIKMKKDDKVEINKKPSKQGFLFFKNMFIDNYAAYLYENNEWKRLGSSEVNYYTCKGIGELFSFWVTIPVLNGDLDLFNNNDLNESLFNKIEKLL